MPYSDISLIYIVTHLTRRVGDFFRHWYVDGFLRSVDWTLNVFEELDRRFALRITAKNWLQPLYQDYTFIGYVWGFIFRTTRIIVGSLVYLIVFLIATALFLAWAAAPVFVVWQIFRNL